MTSTNQEASTIRAVLNFIDPGAGVGVMDDAHRENVRMNVVSHEIDIMDARTSTNDLSLPRNGFEVLRRPSNVDDLRDAEAVRHQYFREVQSLVAEVTGAEHVAPFGEVIRSRRDTAPGESRAPVFNAHVDYDNRTARTIAEQLAPHDDRDRLLAGRIMLVNVWRPLTSVERNPLAVVDASTLSPDDLVPCRLQSSVSGVEDAVGYNVAYNDGQRWYYTSAMEPDEVLVFTIADSLDGAVQCTAHTSFEDPTSQPGAPQRESVEVRTIAYLP